MISIARLQRLGGDRHSGNQAASPDRHQENVEVRHRGEHLERDGALARDDQGIVVGVDERQPLFEAVLDGEVCGFLDASRRPRSRGAPWRRVFSIFTVGVPTGTKMVAGISRLAA